MAQVARRHGHPVSALDKDFCRVLNGPQVTEPFVQGAAAKGRGTGLGLHLVKTMIELHGGRLTIESAPGRGTQVALWLPGHRLQGGH